MKEILFVLMTSLIALQSQAQEENQIETIPLLQRIEIRINSIDSTSLNFYNIYHFTYKNDERKVNASFWTPKDDTIFGLGPLNVKLCRIWEMKIDGSTNLRGHAFVNGLTLMKNDTVMETFHFDEFGESPTLKLCEAEGDTD